MAVYRPLACLILAMVLVGQQDVAWGISPVLRRGAGAAARAIVREAGEEAAGAAAKRAASVMARHGDDAAQAVQKLGPRAAQLIEEAGPHAQHVAKLLARYGDEATWIVRHPKAVELFAKYGDDAGKALARHGEIAVPVIDDFGQAGARALASLNTQNARRLAILHRSGDLAKAGEHQEELIDVIIRYGDKALDFIWRHKGTLFVSAVLIAFIRNPEAFLNAGAQVAGEVVSTAGEVGSEVLTVAVSPLLTLVLLPVAVTVALGNMLPPWLLSLAAVAEEEGAGFRPAARLVGFAGGCCFANELALLGVIGFRTVPYEWFAPSRRSPEEIAPWPARLDDPWAIWKASGRRLLFIAAGIVPAFR